ncbi:hypothetical protein AAG570_000074 [Ranatra chinensis]|uniref:C2H2-type domain-containing protein n=1 Tax=Ranatra chinensis TaxID=642074 RepID=A0ABD0Z6H2_9HEMI
MASHSEPKFSCTLCSKKFSNKQYLNKHYETHNNFRFSCGSCGKQFVRKVHYESHLKTHTDERPFKCPTCDRAFKEQKHWKEHIKRVHRSEFPHKTAPHQMSLPEPQQATTSTHFETLEEIIDSSTQVSSDLFVVWFLLHGVPCTVYVLVGICLKLKYAIYFMLLEDFSFVCIQSYCCILLGLKQPDPYGEYLPINPIILFLVLWQNNSVHA